MKLQFEENKQDNLGIKFQDLEVGDVFKYCSSDYPKVRLFEENQFLSLGDFRIYRETDGDALVVPLKVTPIQIQGVDVEKCAIAKMNKEIEYCEPVHCDTPRPVSSKKYTGNHNPKMGNKDEN